MHLTRDCRQMFCSKDPLTPSESECKTERDGFQTNFEAKLCEYLLSKYLYHLYLSEAMSLSFLLSFGVNRSLNRRTANRVTTKNRY